MVRRNTTMDPRRNSRRITVWTTLYDTLHSWLTLRTGKFFEPQVHLGCRLFSTEEFEGVAGSTVTQKIKNLKAAASLFLSGGGFEANVEGKYETHENKKEEEKTSYMKQSISWCAEEGDTTLCNKYVILSRQTSIYLRLITYFSHIAHPHGILLLLRFTVGV